MFHRIFHKAVNVKSLLAQAALFALIVGAGLWLGSWILSLPTSSASGALPALLTFESPIGDPELHLVKTVDDDFPAPGDIINYTLTFSATSTTGHPDPRAYNMRLYDFLPAGVEYLSSTGPTSEHENGRVLFTADSVGSAEEIAIVRARVLEGYEQLHNYALLVADGVTPTHDSLLTTVEPQPTPWLDLTKTGHTTVLTEAKLNYAIHCENPSDTRMNDATVIDVLPDGLSFVGASPPPDTTAFPLLKWSLGDLGPSESRTIVITGTAPALPGIITNTAIAGGLQGVMTHTLFATQVVTEGAILRLTKQGSATEVDLGDELVYTLRYENIGNKPAMGAVLTDALPTGVTATGIYSTGGTLISPSPFVVDVGDVLPGDPPGEVVITVTVEGVADRPLPNVADITAPGSFPGHAEWNAYVRLAMLYLPIVMRNF
jgi:uncharacterized repeat protein (TIGR01451 family)